MTSLRIAAWNINGLAANNLEVTLLMSQHKLDILLISEAHCKENSIVRFPDFYCYITNHPDGKSHAGSAIIIKKSIKHHQMPNYETEHIQATTITVQDKAGDINVSAVYCPPKHKMTEAMYSDFFGTLGFRYIVGGDWNAKHTSWGSRLTNTRGIQLKLSVDKNKLNTISTGEPTHWPTDTKKLPDLIDFYVTKGLTKLYLKPESCYDSSSDHTPVLLTVSTNLIEMSRPARMCNKFTDWKIFQEHIEESINMKMALKTPEDIDEAAEYITKLIQEACWISTPEVQTRTSSGVTNYPLEIKKAVLEKRRLRRAWHLSRHSEDKINFNRASEDLKSLLQDWNDNSFQEKLESLTATESTNYSLWKIAKAFDRPQAAKPPLKCAQGWARKPQQKADLFADHLAKVFHPNESMDDEFDNEVDTFLNQEFQMDLPPKPVTVREVWRTIKELKDRKAPGFDLITKEIIKQLPRKAVTYITTVYNGILRVQHFPAIWKVSQILMIHKDGKPPSDVTSYRPISLLPILSKVFEKLLLRRILPILMEKGIIPGHQFGFRQQHSTVEQVHRVCDKIRKTLEEKEYCSAVFLDIQQAFDRVWHKGLLYKIKRCLPHSYFLIFKSYLTDRLFQIKEGEITSTLNEIQAGVPQGSVLGPVLYTIFTADLPCSNTVTTATFADDTAILASHTDPVIASNILQVGLDETTKWLRNWRIKASSTKSVQVTYTLRKGNCPPVKLENNTLPHQNCVRYLGLHLDRRLTWNEHIKKKRDQLNIKYKRSLWLLGRNSKLSIDNKLLVYKSILKPVWMYGLQLWGSASNSSIIRIQRMQNIILRTISNVPWYVTNAEIHEHLGMPTVKEELTKVKTGYRDRLEAHPNTLARQLTDCSYVKRLKRKDIL